MQYFWAIDWSFLPVLTLKERFANVFQKAVLRELSRPFMTLGGILTTRNKKFQMLS